MPLGRSLRGLTGLGESVSHDGPAPVPLRLRSPRNNILNSGGSPWFIAPSGLPSPWLPANTLARG
eukprot:3367740-Lingulodinium_polyedra.AAC.1